MTTTYLDALEVELAAYKAKGLSDRAEAVIVEIKRAKAAAPKDEKADKADAALAKADAEIVELKAKLAAAEAAVGKK
jgi:hypothetical protein